MNTNQMRTWLIEEYGGPKLNPTWAAKVNKMSDSQVCATWRRVSGSKK